MRFPSEGGRGPLTSDAFRYGVRTFVLPVVIALAGSSPANAQTLYSIGNPTNDQQYMLELINRARADGGAEAARLGLSGLQEGPPQVGGEPWTIQNTVQPLSWNPQLQNAAQGQSDRLNAADQFFLGVSPHTFGGMTPQQRIAAAGYPAAAYNGPTTTSGHFPGVENVSEEVGQGGGGYTGAALTAAVLRAHDGLFIDDGVPGRGHRNATMLGFFREIGIGMTSGRDNQANPGQPNGTFDSIYFVQDFGTRSNQGPFITGVVYHDANGNHFYDPGEGVGGVRVDVSNAAAYAVTASSGGYSVPITSNGSYTVTFSGGGVATTQRAAIVANSLNVKVDYLSGAPATPSVRGDFNGDAFTDYLLSNASTGRTAIWHLQGNTLLSSAYGPSLPAGWRLACVADLDLDSKPDFVLFNPGTRQTAIWFLDDVTLLRSAYGPTLAAGWSLIAAVDFNNDSKPDYLLFNASTRRTAIWFLNGTALSGSAYGPTLPAGWAPVDAQDFNSNGKPDLVLNNSATRQTAIWYLNGAAFVSSAYGLTLTSGWTLRGSADFNNDTKPDYVLFEPSTRRTALWYLNGTALASGAYGPTLAAGYSLDSP